MFLETNRDLTPSLASQTHFSKNTEEAAQQYLSHEALHYYRSCENTSTILLRERAYPQQVIQECKTGYIIQLIAFQWDTLVYAVHQTLPFLAEVGLACETNLYPTNK